MRPPSAAAASLFRTSFGGGPHLAGCFVPAVSSASAHQERGVRPTSGALGAAASAAGPHQLCRISPASLPPGSCPHCCSLASQSCATACTSSSSQNPEPRGPRSWWRQSGSDRRFWAASAAAVGRGMLSRRGGSSRDGPARCTLAGAGVREAGQGGSPFKWPDPQRPRICILGGGFGGLFTALKLESLLWSPGLKPQVVLVDQSDRFVFKPLLYELLSKEVDVWEIAPRFTDLLAGTDVLFVRDNVTRVSPLDRTLPAMASPQVPGTPSGTGGYVSLSSGVDVAYDWLVLALGAETQMDFVPGAQENALPFATLQDALAADEKLTDLERQRFSRSAEPVRVAIVGAGYSGVELASTISQRLGTRGQVQIIDPASEICPSATAGNRAAAKRVLQARGVALLLGRLVKSLKPAHVAASGAPESLPPFASRSAVTLELERKGGAATMGIATTAGAPQHEIVQADLVLWTVGTKPTLPMGGDGEGSSSESFLTNGRGQAETEPSLRVREHPRVFALGDSAACVDASGHPLASTAQVAFQQADYVGNNLWAAINGRPLLPFKYTHLGEMMTLGTHDAAVSVGFIEGLTLDGRLAHAARKVAYLARLPTTEHKLKVGISWLAKSASDALTALQSTLGTSTPSRQQR